MIAILDYDAGNLKSVEKALTFLGEESIITRNRHEVEKADKLILPGVGSFGAAIEQLKKYEIDKMLREAVQIKPILGICLGLQLMFDGSEESQGVEGLHLLKGSILRIPDKEGLKIPHIGWNSLTLEHNGRLFQGLHEEEPYVYFVHSYYLKAEDEKIVKASAEYGVHIHASVEQGNIFACQFHPEKSSSMGLRILSNFAKLSGGNG